MRGRCITDSIGLVSEADSLLDRRIQGGNMGLKLNVTKAFDTIEWDFLFQVLKNFGFSSQFISWVSILLHSAHISILINGTPRGFFSCNRVVRQVTLCHRCSFAWRR